MMKTGGLYEVDRVGVYRPDMTDVSELGPGEIGYLTASIKQVRDTRVGDTITHERRQTATPLPGFKPSVPVVFCGLFPVDAADFEDLRDAIEKLALNDASFTSEMETSAALGFGFRCGFLGLLHLEVVRDRLEREYDDRPHHHRPQRGLQDPHARRHRSRASQPRRHARSDLRGPHRGTAHQGHHPRPRRVPGRRPQAVPGPPGRAARPHLRRLPRHGRLRPAAERGGVRLLRPAEIRDQGLR